MSLRLAGLRYSSACHSISVTQVFKKVSLSSGLLIRGFGVQIPGGAPVLTWAYARSGSPCEGRFGAMVAPRLLGSPDLVPQGALAGLATARFRPPSSTLLGSGESSGEAIEGDGLGAEGAGAEDEGEHDLQFVRDLVEGHPGAGAFEPVRIMVMKAWARAARVTWRCQPR